MKSSYDLTEGRGGIITRGVYTSLDGAVIAALNADVGGSDGEVYEVESHTLYSDAKRLYGCYHDAYGNSRTGFIPDPLPTRVDANTMERWKILDKRFGADRLKAEETERAQFVARLRATNNRRNPVPWFAVTRPSTRCVGSYRYLEQQAVGWFPTIELAKTMMSEREEKHELLSIIPFTTNIASDLKQAAVFVELSDDEKAQRFEYERLAHAEHTEYEELVRLREAGQ